MSSLFLSTFYTFNILQFNFIHTKGQSSGYSPKLRCKGMPVKIVQTNSLNQRKMSNGCIQKISTCLIWNRGLALWHTGTPWSSLTLLYESLILLLTLPSMITYSRYRVNGALIQWTLQLNMILYILVVFFHPSSVLWRYIHLHHVGSTFVAETWDGWNTSYLSFFGAFRPIFRGELAVSLSVSGRVYKIQTSEQKPGKIGLVSLNKLRQAYQ